MSVGQHQPSSGVKRTQRVTWATQEDRIQHNLDRQRRYQKKLSIAFGVSIGAIGAAVALSLSAMVVVPAAGISLLVLLLLLEANAHLKEIRGRR